MCTSNLRQIGQGVMLYSADNGATESTRLDDLSSQAIWADAFGKPDHVRQGHGDSVSVLYSDGAVHLQKLNPNAPLLSNIPDGPSSSSHNSEFDAIWADFD